MIIQKTSRLYTDNRLDIYLDLPNCLKHAVMLFRSNVG